MKIQALPLIVASVCCLSVNSAMAAEAIHPAVMDKAEIASDIAQHPNVIIEKINNGPDGLDVISMISSDQRFAVGKFKATGPYRTEYTKPRGIDEYMHFLEGGITLTSSDGKVTEIKAGDSVTIPKEWTGIWETEGYTKIYIIYVPADYQN